MEKVKEVDHLLLTESVLRTFVFSVPALDINFWTENLFELLELDQEAIEPNKDQFFKMIHPEDRAKIELELGLLMSGQEYQRVNRYRLLLPSGQQKYVTAIVQKESFHNEIGFLIFFQQSQNLLDQVGDISSNFTSETLKSDSLARFFEGIGYWEYYPGYDHVLWSNEIYRLLDVPKSKHLNFEVFFETAYPDDLEVFNEVVNSLTPDDPNFYFIIRHLINGCTVWGLSRGTSIWEGSKLLKLMGSFEDVTSHREAEDKLYRVQQNGGIGWYEINLIEQGKSIASDAYLEMHECDLKGHMPTLNELLVRIHPGDHEMIITSRNRLYKYFESWEPFVYRVLREDGSTRYFESSGEVIRSPLDNQPLKVLAIVRDITESKQKEIQLIQAHELARLGWYESDIISGKQKISQQFLDIHELPEFSEQALKNKIHPEDVHKLDKIINEYRSYNDGYSFDYRIILESGDIRYIRNTGSYIHDPVDGHLAKVSGTVQDISEFKSLEERLQRAQRISQTGWFEFDIVHPQLSSFSKEWLEMHDFEANPSGLGDFLKKLHPVDRNLIPNLKDFLEQMPTSWDNLEYRIVNKHGQKKYISNSAQVLLKDNKPVKIFGTTRDMTNFRVTEQALKESERKYRLMSENSKDAILLLESRDKDMIISFASDYAQKLSGYSKYDLQGMVATQLMHKDDRIYFTKNVLPKLMFGQESTKLSFRLFRRDGTYVWVEASIGVLIEETPLKVQLSVRDISERKEYEERLLRTNTDLNAMIKASDDIVFIVDKRLQFERVIVKNEESLHMPVDHFIGKSIDSVWDDANGTALRNYVREVFELGQYTFHEYSRELNGQEDWYRANIHAFKGYDQEERVSVVIEKITRQKEAELSLLKSMQMERELSRMRTNFVSMASHQFRTPLTVIKSNMQLLEMAPYEDPLLNKVRKRLTKEVDRMVSLMEDILLLGKLQSGGLNVRIEEVNLLQLVENIKSDVDLGQQDGRTLGIEMKGDLVPVMLDMRLVHQSILNLVTNAFKYSKGEANPRIILDFTLGECVALHVEDFGLGIPKDEQERIFKDFYRSEKVQDIQGTGLGLSICTEFLKLNNCKLSLKSEVNRGSTFTVKIPKQR